MKDRIKLTTSLEEGYTDKLEEIAKAQNLRTAKKALDKGRAIMFLVDKWEELQHGMDTQR